MFSTVRKVSRLAIASLGILVLATACASRQPSRSGGSAPGQQMPTTASLYPWPQPTSVGPLQKVQEYPTTGLTLAPPPAKMAPLISAQDAYDVCKKTAPCPRGHGAPAIQLALATNKLPGRDHTPTLIYVLRWENIPFPQNGPAGGSPKPAILSTWLTMIDANTGDSLGSYQIGEPAS